MILARARVLLLMFYCLSSVSAHWSRGCSGHRGQPPAPPSWCLCPCPCSSCPPVWRRKTLESWETIHCTGELPSPELSAEHVGVEDAPSGSPRAGHVGRVRRDEVLQRELGSEGQHQHGEPYTGGGALDSPSWRQQEDLPAIAPLHVKEKRREETWEHGLVTHIASIWYPELPTSHSFSVPRYTTFHDMISRGRVYQRVSILASQIWEDFQSSEKF